MEEITWYGKNGEDEMGFNIRPGMTTWNSMSEKYKKEYHIYTAKMEKLKFENDRKLREIKQKKEKKEKVLIGPNKNASIKEKQWFSWMEK